MPFVAMNACTQDYSLPSAYPLGVNGLGDDPPPFKPLPDPDKDPLGFRAMADKAQRIMSELEMNDRIWKVGHPGQNHRKVKMVPQRFNPNRFAADHPQQQYAEPGMLFGMGGLGASAADCQRMHDAPLTGPGAVTYTEYANAGCLSFNPGSGTFVQPQLSIPAMPDTPFAQKVGAVAGAIQGALTPYLQLQAQTAQARAAGQMQNKQIQDALRMQSGSDNTNLYLIGGGVLLAGLLVFALARRG